MAHLTVHIALDDQTDVNGALYWVPGSHRWMRNGGPLPQAASIAREKMNIAKSTGGDAMEAPSFDTNMDALYDNVLNDDERAPWAERPPRSLHLKASASSCAKRFAHGTRSYMDGYLMKGLPQVAKGELLGGKFHPVVFDTTRLDMTKLPVAGV